MSLCPGQGQARDRESVLGAPWLEAGGHGELRACPVLRRQRCDNDDEEEGEGEEKQAKEEEAGDEEAGRGLSRSSEKAAFNPDRRGRPGSLGRGAQRDRWSDWAGTVPAWLGGGGGWVLRCT